MKPWVLPLAFVASSFVLAAAVAQPADRLPDPVGRPWLQCPINGKPPKRFYPERAQRLEVEGSVVVRCRVQATGKPSACIWMKESVPNFDFGAAAEALACTFKINPERAAKAYQDPGDGTPIVDIPLDFKAPK